LEPLRGDDEAHDDECEEGAESDPEYRGLHCTGVADEARGAKVCLARRRYWWVDFPACCLRK